MVSVFRPVGHENGLKDTFFYGKTSIDRSGMGILCRAADHVKF